MRLKSLARKLLPTAMLKAAAHSVGGFRDKEKLGLVAPPWYAYGVLSAADHAAKVGVPAIWALEFGVANGRGMRRLNAISAEVSRLTGIDIYLAGFDTGTGMREPADYRDHTEKYRAGDFPMLDVAALEADLGTTATLVIGDIADTVHGFRESLSGQCPVGFVAVDVDVYTAAKAALCLFDGPPEHYLPFTFTYFDDSGGRTHFNRFCGELLAIGEFNEEHELRKIDVDRGVWGEHRLLGPQLWFERMHITHVFDHPWRCRTSRVAPKVIR